MGLLYVILVESLELSGLGGPKSAQEQFSFDFSSIQRIGILSSKSSAGAELNRARFRLFRASSTARDPQGVRKTKLEFCSTRANQRFGEPLHCVELGLQPPRSNIAALIMRMGIWGPLYYVHIKTHKIVLVIIYSRPLYDSTVESLARGLGGYFERPSKRLQIRSKKHAQ